MKRTVVITVVCLLLCTPFCQLAQSKIDSLKKDLADAKEDTNKVKTLVSLASNLARTDPKQGALYAHEGLALAKKLNYPRGEAGASNRLAVISYYQGNLAEGLDYGIRSLKLYEAIGFKGGIASAEMMLGIIYNGKGDLDRALGHYTAALKIHQESGDKPGMSAAYNNISLVHFLKKEYESALQSYTQALALFNELKDDPGAAVALNNIGNTYSALKDYEKALEFYSRSLALKQRLKDDYGMVELYFSMGRMHYAREQYGKARGYFMLTLKYAGELGERAHLTEAYDMLARCDSAEKDFPSAYANLRKYGYAKDSLMSAESVKQMAEMQTKYETEKKELQISNQEKEIEKQTTLKTAFAIGFAGMILFGVAVFRSYRLKKKANEESMRQKQVIEQKNKEILDSIHYARRIQHSLMPTEKFIARILKKLKK